METKFILRNLRIKNKISQEKLASIVGVTRGAVAQWENGFNLPSNVALIKMADYFHCSVDYILGRTDCPDPISIDNSTTNFQFAFSDYDKLTDDQKEIIKNLAASLIAQNEKK